MVSYGPDIQNMNFTHMVSFVDYPNRTKPQLSLNPGSLYDYIYKNPNMKKFRTIVERAGMAGQLNEEEANFTLFIPLDQYLKHIPEAYFINMDDGQARQILNASTYKTQIDGRLLVSSPVAYYYTKNDQMRMYVTNISRRTVLNNCANVVKFDIQCTNGIIHIVDGLVAPNLDTFMS